MTAGMVVVVRVRAEALSDALAALLYRRDRDSLELAYWQAQRLVSGCDKALAGGRPRDPRTGLR